MTLVSEGMLCLTKIGMAGQEKKSCSNEWLNKQYPIKH